NGENRLYAWDCAIDLEKLWAHYRRILAADGNVVLTADQPFTSQLVVSNLEWFKYDLIWDKMRVNGFLHANSRPMKQTEDVLVFSPLGAAPAARVNNTHMTYNPQGLVSVNLKKVNSAKRLGNFLHTPAHMGANGKLLGNGEYRQKFTNYPKEIIKFPLDECVHPTQKPVALMEYLILTYSNEGDSVLDNCMGAGTTGVAAAKTNRRFIGMEINEEFFSIAAKRMRQKRMRPAAVQKQKIQKNDFSVKMRNPPERRTV
ncbi:MAG: site-specific DNA-methyltransferase, partial [Betaproteobacteria bacterium]|nr:site-specific DNA-methyltransferase [Betaproteobacteria bacterium]